jgi:DNA-binding transcriptional regulator YhcF (GntR family)
MASKAMVSNRDTANKATVNKVMVSNRDMANRATVSKVTVNKAMDNSKEVMVSNKEAMANSKVVMDNNKEDTASNKADISKEAMVNKEIKDGVKDKIKDGEYHK